LSKDPDSTSIGELEEFLRNLPAELKHLPVKVLDGAHAPLYLALKNITFTDGKRYYSLEALKHRATFPGMYLEFYGEKHD
jgi:hypothetical protein